MLSACSFLNLNRGEPCSGEGRPVACLAKSTIDPTLTVGPLPHVQILREGRPEQARCNINNLPTKGVGFWRAQWASNQRISGGVDTVINQARNPLGADANVSVGVYLWSEYRAHFVEREVRVPVEKRSEIVRARTPCISLFLISLCRVQLGLTNVEPSGGHAFFSHESVRNDQGTEWPGTVTSGLVVRGRAHPRTMDRVRPDA